ncbi:MAG: formate dehydrogenase accessory sulfurtransferase FdhD [Chitinivibrionales bacterium]|nr:formate dehydrogenase accessory sulfurtransferase FdhD [Chitinivibrionales bacterium]
MTELGPSMNMDVVRLKEGRFIKTEQPVATEVPLTIYGNGVEIATLLCLPTHCEQLVTGFLFTSAFIKSIDEVVAINVDTARWTATCELTRTPDAAMMSKRLFTPGCGRGVMFTSLAETGLRQVLQSTLRLSASRILDLARWLQQCSSIFNETGGVHTAALSKAGLPPQDHIDDIGRHNAVDKVIGKHLMETGDFSETVLVCSGRTSSEILHKVRRAGIPVVVSRGGPTHQSVLKARDQGITLVGFARSGGFTVYSHKERIDCDTICESC